MTPSTHDDDGSTAPATNAPDALAGDDGGARQYPGRVRGQRLEITSADLTMYSMITGRAPSSEERERALTWSEADPMNDKIAATTGYALSTMNGSAGGAALPAHALRPWHPLALSMRLRDLWFNGLTIRMARPQISNWVKRLSGAVQQGRRRVQDSGR